MDLVINGQNGYTVDPDEDSLFRSLKQISELSEEEVSLMGLRSLDIMMEWANRDLADSLVRTIESVRDQKSGKTAGDSA